MNVAIVTRAIELLLGILSYATWKVCLLFWMSILRVLQVATSRKRRWHSLDEVAQILGINHFLLTGPRWNVHAAIYSVPVVAEREIRFFPGGLAQARSWSLVAHSRRGSAAVTSSHSHSADSSGAVTLSLPCAGHYVLGLRIYGAPESLHIPEISENGKLLVEGRFIDNSTSSTYEAIRGRRSLFGLLTQYCAYAFLKYRSLFSESFIRQCFLPVGNPDTIFLYDTLSLGDRVRTSTSPSFLARNDIYYVSYNRSSFPVNWTRCDAPDYVTPAAGCDGYYLIRIIAREKTEDVPANSVQVSRVRHCTG